jgi:hypothetical protein
MDHFLEINGVKLIPDFLILEYLVLNFSMLSINVIRKKQQITYSVVGTLMVLLEVFLMLSLMQLMSFAVLELLK